ASGLRRPPSDGNGTYRTPTPGNSRARASALYCGHFRDPGNRRTSATAFTPCDARISTNPPNGRVECPIVQMVEPIDITSMLGRVPPLPVLRGRVGVGG